MVERLEEYLNRKGLELNTDKTKIMRFRRERGRWLFDRLIWTVMSHGVEMWGWEKRESMERIEKRYLR